MNAPLYEIGTFKGDGEELDVLETLNSLAADNLALVAVPLFLLAMTLEASRSFRERSDLYELHDTMSSIAMGALAFLVEALPKAAAFIVFDILHDLSPLKDVIGRTPVAWVLLFLLDDLTFYGFHRANHSVRLLWAGHVPHHSSPHLNLSTALRQGVGERLHKFLFWAPLALLGFDPVMIFTVMSLSLMYQFFLHTQSIGRLPEIIELIFNTPSHHRVHHASNSIYLNRNHGGVLILWDRLFGTFMAEQPSEPPRFGLPEGDPGHLPLVVATHEYRALLRDVRACASLGACFVAVFGPPGQVPRAVVSSMAHRSTRAGAPLWREVAHSECEHVRR